MVLPAPPKFTTPIPNNPFYSDPAYSLCGVFGCLIIGSGLTVDYSTGSLTASGGGGGVTALTATSPVTIGGTATVPNIDIDKASNTALGVVQFATAAEVAAKTSDTVAITPLTLGQTYMPCSGGTFTGPVIFNSNSLFKGSVINEDTVTNCDDVNNYGSVTNYSRVTNCACVINRGCVANWCPVTFNDAARFCCTPTYAPGVCIGAAANVSYSNTTSGLAATDVQGAIDEIALDLAPATTVALGTVCIGGNIGVTLAGEISVASASTALPGVVQLYDGTDSTATNLALTANQGKILQDQIDVLSVSSNIILAGTYDASTGLVDSVTAAGTSQGFTVGAVPPAPIAGNTDYFLIVDVQGSTAPATATATPPFHIGDWFLSDGTVWTFLNVGYQPGAATTTNEGVVYLATDSEVQAGLDISNKAINPASLQSKMSDGVSTLSSNTIASSTAVKTAYDLANLAIPKACVTAKGTIISGTAASTPVALPVGTNGQVLAANSACSTGLEWVSAVAAGVQSVTSSCVAITVNNTDPLNPVLSVTSASTGSEGVVQLNDTVTSTSIVEAGTANAVKTAYDLANLAIPKACATAKGDLIVATAASTPAALAVGTDGQVLLACSACTTGLTWGAAGSNATPTLPGIVFGCTLVGGNTALGYNSFVSNNGCWNTAIGGDSLCALSGLASFNVGLGFQSGNTTTTGSQNVAIGPIVSVANPAGDCQLAIGFMTGSCWLTGDSTKAIKPGAGIIDCAGSCGTAGQVLMSDGANAVCWGAAGGTPGIPCACITAKGTLVTGTAANTPVALPVGTNNGQVLTVNSACATGLEWSSNIDVNNIQSSGYYRQVSQTTASSLDWATSAYKQITVSSATSITFANPPATGTVGMMTVELALDASGSVTWPASVKWPGGTTPSLTASRTNLFMFSTSDGGTTVLGSSLTNYTV